MLYLIKFLSNPKVDHIIHFLFFDFGNIQKDVDFLFYQNLLDIKYFHSTELLLIAGVALLIFGGKKVPELMKGLGKGVQSFKQGMKEPIEEDKPQEVTDEAKAEPKEND